MYRIGFDVGGTFTDFTALNEDTGAVHHFKVPSTQDDPSEAIQIGLPRVIEALDIDPVGSGPARGRAERQVWLDGGWQATQVYARSSLAAGTILEGPAIIEEMNSARLAGLGRGRNRPTRNEPE